MPTRAASNLPILAEPSAFSAQDFLCLAALYESWSIPLAVLLVVPTGVVGAVFAMLLRDMPNDVYFKVGLITVIGLTAKNAINSRPRTPSLDNTPVWCGLPESLAASRPSTAQSLPVAVRLRALRYPRSAKFVQLICCLRKAE